MAKLLRRLRYLLNRSAHERELQEEMQAHRGMMRDLDPAAEDRVGVPPGKARRTFGSDLRWREEAREAWGWGWLDQLRQDLAFAVRQLVRAPGFAATAVVILALGVGLNLAIFHVVKAVLFDRVPVPDVERLLRAVRQAPEREYWAFPPEGVAFLQEHADLFEYVVGERLGTLPVQVNDAEQAGVQFVSGNYFSALSVDPAGGRLLAPSDDAPGAPLVGVVSYGYWQRRFGGNAGIVGGTLEVNGLPLRILGVTPAGFAGLSMSRGDLWLPMAARERIFPPESDGTVAPPALSFPDTAIVGVLRPGISVEAGSAQMAALTAELRTRQPDLFEERKSTRVRPLIEDERNDGPYSTLVPLVLLVLLAACANLGNMLLARGLARAREIDTRLAVGAARSRLVRQLMTESLLLAVLGGLGGLVVGRLAAQLLVAVFTGSLNVRVAIDLPVIVAAAVLSVGAALVFGLAPAFQLTGRRHQITSSRQALVGIQVAVSCLLLILSGLMVRGAQRQTALARQADYASMVVVEPDMEGAGLSGPSARAVLNEIAATLRTVPGVVDLTVSTDPIYGPRITSAPGLPRLVVAPVSPDYFEVMQLGLVRGSLFAAGDRPADAVVISEAAARAAFDVRSTGDPLGQPWDPAETGRGPIVVGIVQTSTLAQLRESTAVEIYAPLTDDDVLDASIIVRTRGDASALMRQIRDLATLPGLPPSVWILQRPVDQLVQHSQVATQVIGVLGVTAAALAAFGIFGLMVFTVQERRSELAVRLTLGARTPSLARVLVGRYLTPLAAGAAIGTGLAAVGARALRGLVLGLGLVPFDTGGYALGLAVFALTALAAAFIPIRRATRTDPASVLRYE